jgi:hypothetical protein
MSFAKWKERSNLMDRYLPFGYHAMAYRVAQAAYKSGQRDGRKQVEVEIVDAVDRELKFRDSQK